MSRPPGSAPLEQRNHRCHDLLPLASTTDAPGTPEELVDSSGSIQSSQAPTANAANDQLWTTLMQGGFWLS